MAVRKSRKCSGSIIYSYFIDSTFTAVKRNAELKGKSERGSIYQYKVYERVTFPSKMVYKSVRDRTWGQASPGFNLC